MKTNQRTEVDKLIHEVTAYADHYRDANYIKLTSNRDRSVKLTTHCNGRDLAWINYNQEQLTELIRMLQSYQT